MANLSQYAAYLHRNFQARAKEVLSEFAQSVLADSTHGGRRKPLKFVELQ